MTQQLKLSLKQLSKSQHLQGDDYNIFVSNAKKWNCYITDNKEPQINLLTYSGEYCIRDVEVLKNGYEKFGELMKEITKDKDDETGETGFASSAIVRRSWIQSMGTEPAGVATTCSQ